MWTVLQVIGGVMAWAVWGALGAVSLEDRPTPGLSELDIKNLRGLALVASPILATYQIARWFLWRYSAEGKHEKRRRKLERQREIEQEYDAILEDLDNG